jgi:hypothetical protein
MNMKFNKTILDIFHQGADCGTPSRWCVKYKTDSGGVDYEYFVSWTDACDYAMKYSYND